MVKESNSKTEVEAKAKSNVEKLVTLMGMDDMFDEARRMTKRQVCP